MDFLVEPFNANSPLKCIHLDNFSNKTNLPKKSKGMCKRNWCGEQCIARCKKLITPKK